MEDNKFRQLIKSGRFAIGLAITIADPAIVELTAYAGFDFIHLTAIAPSIVERMDDLVRAAEAAQIPVIVGIPGGNLDPSLIGKALDLGIDGIKFALVSSRQQAENIVRLCRIPPMGDREVFPGGRLGKYWGISMEEFTRRANEAVIWVKIETKEGLEHAEEILSVPGIDIVDVGVSDLCRSLGVRRDAPVIVEAQQHIIKVAKSAGVAYMQLAMTAEDVGEWVKREESIRLFFLATDGTQIGLAFRGLIRRCNELVAQFAKGRVEGVVSRVPGSLTPWLTTQSPGDKR